MGTRLLIPLFGTLALLFGGVGLLLGVLAVPAATIDGIVVDLDGSPLADAAVRWRATDHTTTTAPDGRFSLGSLPEGQEIEITAWADGYYIASTHVTPPHQRHHPHRTTLSPEGPS